MGMSPQSLYLVRSVSPRQGMSSTKTSGPPEFRLPVFLNEWTVPHDGGRVPTGDSPSLIPRGRDPGRTETGDGGGGGERHRFLVVVVSTMVLGQVLPVHPALDHPARPHVPQPLRRVSTSSPRPNPVHSGSGGRSAPTISSTETGPH